jgi:hypothetical protein
MDFSPMKRAVFDFLSFFPSLMKRTAFGLFLHEIVAQQRGAFSGSELRGTNRCRNPMAGE